MEQHRDEPLRCADCAASFIFSAAEAAVFAERGLAAPKRCKDCRRARKNRAAAGVGAGDGQGSHRPQGLSRPRDGDDRSRRREAQGGRYGAPVRRYTGDVNEYRSPMADSFTTGTQRPYPQTPGRDGNRRLPGSGPHHPPAHGGAPRGPSSAPKPPGRMAEGANPAARRRPQAEMSAITCDACGAQAEVPFKPAEGREVYCPACYRARRPAS